MAKKMLYVYKIILSVLAIVVCTFVGYKMSEKYSLRSEFFNDFYRFNREMINQLTYFKRRIPEIISNFSCKNQFSILLDDYREYINGKKLCLDKFWYLSLEEKELITAYFVLLGKSDATSQLNNLNSYNEKLKNLTTDTVNEEKKYKKLYVKLGFFAGLSVFVLII